MHLGGDAGAGVGHGEAHRGTLGRAAFPAPVRRGLQGEEAAARHGVAGVDREVHDHLLQLAGIGEDGADVVAEAQAQLDVLADDALEHLVARPR